MKKVSILFLMLSLLIGCESEKHKSSKELYQEYLEAAKSENTKTAEETKKIEKFKSGTIRFEDAMLDFKKESRPEYSDRAVSRVYRFTEGKHRYIMFVSAFNPGFREGLGYLGVSHDPDCNFCRQK